MSKTKLHKTKMSAILAVVNTIHRFPEDTVLKGRMDCMRRWRIQGTVLTSGIASLLTAL